MSLVKSQIKLSVVGDVGNRLDDMLEGAVAQQQQCIGAKAAAAQIAGNIKKLVGVIEQDFEKGDIEKAIEEGPLAVLKVIKTYVSRGVGACEVTAEHFEQREQIATGKVQALQQSVQMMKKMHDSEQAKVANVLAALEQGDATVDGEDIVAMPGASRPTGVHPGKTIKQQRLAEQAAQAGEGNGQSGRATAAPAASEKPARKKSTRKKSARKKASKKTTKKPAAKPAG
jgi:hypothetical protein